VKNKKISGLHNWIYFAEMEKSGALNYKGWLKKVDLSDVGIENN
jgi:poly(U)-specific endoribonuclease